jgi:K+-transporting ATPase ATPase C chain
MLSILKPAAILLLSLTLLTGLIYPAVVTLLAQGLLPDQANGSLIRDKQDRIVGSALIGQQFTAPHYFWGRPSATSPAYNAAASSGSNLGPTNPLLFTNVADRIKTLQKADPDNHALVPVDLVTTSASGLDPHISIAAAHYQISRVAKARHINPDKLRKLVNDATEPRQWLIFGEPRVNVLQLNLALDNSFPSP